MEALHDHSLPEDPRELIELFRTSQNYRLAFEDFFKGKDIHPDVSEEEKHLAFKMSEKAKVALVNFVQINGGFHFNPVYYSPEMVEAITSYIDQVRRNLQSSTVREEADVERSILHRNLARALVQEGVVQSEKIARVVGRLILIDKGLDTYSSASKPAFEVIKRKLR